MASPAACLIALASARAGRGAKSPAFLLTDEKTRRFVVGLGFLVARAVNTNGAVVVRTTTGPTRQRSLIAPAWGRSARRYA